MTKNILIVGAGIEACEGIRIAKAMGLGLIVADGNPDAPGFDMADWRIVASTYDGKAILNELSTLIEQGLKIDGAIAMCADVPMSVAIITNALGLPGLSLESAFWVSDKLAMKDRLKTYGVPIPNYADVSDISILAQRAAELGLPLIIKPVDSRGARGVQLIESMEMLEPAWHIAAAESPTSRVMIEEYLPGPQFSTETLASKGHYFTLGFADRNYEWLTRTKPYIIENGGDAPTALSPKHKAEVISVLEQAAQALAITQGVIKGDMVYTPQGAKVIEVAGRLSGGFFSTTQIPLATGVNFIEKAIKLALGDDLSPDEVTPEKTQAVAIRYLDLPCGVVDSIEGMADANAAPGVELLKLFITPGSQVQSLSNHTQRSGFAIAVGDSKQQAITRANDALALIRVKFRKQ
ncbi:ATP-grasp domain-containing protein [Shewanella sp. GXUN23E]|uniref:ATP-grasp domain-containing protein n=1 Tax=Shewanella sp. GXUN23E TaxID=3422498 RepID=UPI003D7E53E7